MVRNRVRIRFSKEGDLRLIGHRDLVRLMERLFRRAELSLGMSQGFHPKPRMTFPLALALGIAGHDEVMELELVETYTAADLLARLSSHAVPGLAFGSVEVLPPGTPKARVRKVAYETSIGPDRRADVQERAARLMGQATWLVDRPGKPEPIDVRRFLEGVSINRGTLNMRLVVAPGPNPGARDVLGILGLADLEHEGVFLTRTAVELEQVPRNLPPSAAPSAFA